MVDKNVIVGRAQQIEGHLAKIAPYMSLSLKKFLDDPVAQDIVEYNLFQIVNHLIDMVQHIVVDEGYGFPDSAYEAAEILPKKGILKQASGGRGLQEDDRVQKCCRARLHQHQ